MIDCRELYLLTQRQEEWDFHEKYVACEQDFLVQLYKYYRDIHLIPGNHIWISTRVLAFKCCNILSPKLLSNFNILDCHWTVVDIFAENHPCVVLS